MSVSVQNWVWQNSDTNGNDRLVLLAIADEADDDGSNAYPSMERLALKCRVNRATVMRTIRRLEEVGEIIVERPEDYGRGRFNRYLVVMGREGLSVADCQPLPKSRDATKQRRERARNGAEGRAQVRPDPLTLLPVDPTSTANPSRDDDFDRFWLAYPKARRTAKPDARAAFAIAVKKVPADQIIEAAERYTADPNRLDEFTPYPQKWLKQERWNAPPEPPRNGSRQQRPANGPVLSKSFQNVEAVFNGMRANQGEIGQ